MKSTPPDYTPSHIANFFLSKEGHDMGNLKLNKIVYISLGYSLAILDRDLFQEPVQAWKYGPVIPSLYHEFKHFQLNRINRLSEFFSYSKGKLQIPTIDNNDKDLNTLLKAVDRNYGKFSPYELIAKTHQQDGPWSEHYEKGKFGIEIPRDTIKKFYKSLIED